MIFVTTCPLGATQTETRISVRVPVGYPSLRCCACSLRPRVAGPSCRRRRRRRRRRRWRPSLRRRWLGGGGGRRPGRGPLGVGNAPFGRQIAPFGRQIAPFRTAAAIWDTGIRTRVSKREHRSRTGTQRATRTATRIPFPARAPAPLWDAGAFGPGRPRSGLWGRPASPVGRPIRTHTLFGVQKGRLRFCWAAQSPVSDTSALGQTLRQTSSLPAARRSVMSLPCRYAPAGTGPAGRRPAGPAGPAGGGGKMRRRRRSGRAKSGRPAARRMTKPSRHESGTKTELNDNR